MALTKKRKREIQLRRDSEYFYFAGGGDIRGVSLREKIEARSMPEPNSGCWLWLARVDTFGYGRMNLRNRNMSPMAHRSSWIAYYGAIPDGLLVLHKCDNPCCVNPEHLFLGTHLDNSTDKINKGRAVQGVPCRGERSGCAKLTDEMVRKIRLSRGSQRKIAQRFGVSQAAVWNVKVGRTWSHVK